MTKIASLFAVLATMLACLLPAVPAQALVARTFVSAAGSDSNNCANVMTPCRHFAAAYAATAANGEIYVLDPANYGALTITGPVSIEGHGWASVAPGSGSPAINANPGDKVSIIGVVLDGTAIANTTGIQFNSGGSLNIQDSVIRNFGGDGINVASAATGRLYISNTSVSYNGGNGIVFLTAAVVSVLSHIETIGNAGSGISVPNAQIPFGGLTISDSDSAHNADDGVGCPGGLDTTGTLIWVIRSTVVGNAGAGLNGARCFINVRGSTLHSNAAGNFAGNTFSFGDNVAGDDESVPTGSNAFQ